jgi:pyruvate carboxylase
LNVLENKEFLAGVVDTGFIASNPDLLAPLKERDRAQKLLQYLGHVIVNGTPKELGAVGSPPSSADPFIPIIEAHPKTKRSLKEIFDTDGAEAFAKAVRANDGLLVTDTTWRDAHQSLLATRLRTIDMLNVAEPTTVALRNAYSLECWGGATFDVAMRFLRECPWDRLANLREAVPDIPFQMLLRGANAVGYTSYPDNVGKLKRRYGWVCTMVFGWSLSHLPLFALFSCTEQCTSSASLPRILVWMSSVSLTLSITSRT